MKRCNRPVGKVLDQKKRRRVEGGRLENRRTLEPHTRAIRIIRGLIDNRKTNGLLQAAGDFTPISFAGSQPHLEHNSYGLCSWKSREGRASEPALVPTGLDMKASGANILPWFVPSFWVCVCFAWRKKEELFC